MSRLQMRQSHQRGISADSLWIARPGHFLSSPSWLIECYPEDTEIEPYFSRLV